MGASRKEPKLSRASTLSDPTIPIVAANAVTTTEWLEDLPITSVSEAESDGEGAMLLTCRDRNRGRQGFGRRLGLREKNRNGTGRRGSSIRR